MKKFLQRLKERKCNRGSALVMVISVVAIIGILAAALLSVSLLTYRMKNTYKNSTRNFYDAESVLDDINVGLQEDVSIATGIAYTYTLENYSNASEDVRKQNYLERYQQELLNLIEDTTLSNAYSKHYSLAHLQAKVSAEALSGTTIVSADGAVALNQNMEEGTYTIKNLMITYVDDQDYMTEIKTDIVLSCPQIDFTQQATAPLDLTTYAFVANENTVAQGANIEVEGNAYLGNEGADFSTGSITFTPQGGDGRLVSAGLLNASNGAIVTINDGFSTWLRGIRVDSSDVTLGGTTYLNNDIVLVNNANTSTSLTANGRLYAYGNPSTAAAAENYNSATKTFEMGDPLNHPADFSSAVLINSKNAKVDFSGLEELILAGNAYVGASLRDESNSDVKMGESVALKSDQRAYLVPAGYIAPYCTNHGGINPMSEDTYLALRQEMMDKLGYTSDAQIGKLDFVRSSTDSVQGIPTELEKYGVIDIQQEVCPIMTMGGTINYVYFFLVFDSDGSAKDFADSYYAKEQNLSTLQGRLDVNHTEVLYPNTMKDEPENFTFYYNGSVVVPSDIHGDNTATFYTGKCTSLSTTDSASLIAKENEFQNTYASLRHKLTTDYSTLTADERTKTVYQYLVADMTNVDLNKNISYGTRRVFATNNEVAADAQMCAVVANGDYTIGADESGKPIHAVIASGNVTVTRDFEGIIIAGGTVTILPGITVKANSNLAQQALKIKDANDVRAADYLNNGDRYLIESSGSQRNTYGKIQFADCVTYKNWVKQ